MPSLLESLVLLKHDIILRLRRTPHLRETDLLLDWLGPLNRRSRYEVRLDCNSRYLLSLLSERWDVICNKPTINSGFTLQFIYWFWGALAACSFLCGCVRPWFHRYMHINEHYVPSSLFGRVFNYRNKSPIEELIRSCTFFKRVHGQSWSLIYSRRERFADGRLGLVGL